MGLPAVPGALNLGASDLTGDMIISLATFGQADAQTTLDDIASFTGGGLVVAVAAAGTTQGTATQVAFGTVIVTSTTAAVSDPWGGIWLPAGIGQVVVVNTNATLIRVYPPTGGTIDTEAANAPVLVAAAAGGSNGTATFAAPVSGTYYSR